MNHKIHLVHTRSVLICELKSQVRVMLFFSVICFVSLMSCLVFVYFFVVGSND